MSRINFPLTTLSFTNVPDMFCSSVGSYLVLIIACLAAFSNGIVALAFSGAESLLSYARRPGDLVLILVRAAVSVLSNLATSKSGKNYGSFTNKASFFITFCATRVTRAMLFCLFV